MIFAPFTVALRPCVLRHRLADPVRHSPWDCAPVGIPHVRLALLEQRLEEEPISAECTDPHRHAARIAFLMAFGWDDPIEIDVGVPSLNAYARWPITDGNHRLYAAILSRRPRLAVEISGDLDHAAELLGFDAGLIDAHFAASEAVA